jgi:hypothetical protein
LLPVTDATQTLSSNLERRPSVATSRGLIAELERALAASLGAQDAASAQRVNELLSALPRCDDKQAAAQFLSEKLDENAFGSLQDPKGRSCRSEAVAALLALGYPHALLVSPEDLEHFRSRGRFRLGRWWLLAPVLLGAVGASEAIWAGLIRATSMDAFAPLEVHAAATLGVAAMSILLGGRRWPGLTSILQFALIGLGAALCVNTSGLFAIPTALALATWLLSASRGPGNVRSLD